MSAAVPAFDAMLTERTDPRFKHIDRMSTAELAAAMNTADAEVPAAVSAALPEIGAAVDDVAARMASGGRLLYVGAGTSGRLAMLDAAECPPTFNTEPGQIDAVLAGGLEAFYNAKEGTEDDTVAGAAAIGEREIGQKDVVVGVAASGRTPFVVAAVEEARKRGALTVGLSCNDGTPLSAAAEHAIEVLVGPELVAGSTRLKSGTAQKLVLNMISTITMIKLGKTYGNLMVDMRAANEKLVIRAIRIVAEIAGVDDVAARSALDRADRDVKTAVVMLERDIDADVARALLERAGGRLAAALNLPKPTS